jgi:hypothetical protein
MQLNGFLIVLTDDFQRPVWLGIDQSDFIIRFLIKYVFVAKKDFCAFGI